jgi:hypothetical protein
MHQHPWEKGWVPSWVEDFLATDQEKRRCGEILMRSTLGLWDGLKSMGADEGPQTSKWARVEENERNRTQAVNRCERGTIAVCRNVLELR